MEKNEKRRRIIYAVLTVIVLSGIIVGTFYDYEITKALSGAAEGADGSLSLNIGWFGKLVDFLGELPSPVLGALAVCIIDINLRGKFRKKEKIISVAVSSVIGFALMSYVAYKMMKALSGELFTGHYIIIIVIALTLAGLIRFIAENIPDKTLKRLFAPALFTACAAFILLVFSEGIKFKWGRVRFSELVAAGSPEAFTPWYKPNWFSGSRSMYSGHTANATLLLLLPLWVKGKKEKLALNICIPVWIVFIMISRLCLGAHYLSDIMFGFMFAFILVQLTLYLYNATFSARSDKQKSNR